MALSTLRDGTQIADFGRPYIVAELNSSHGGNIERAKKMIDEAARIGCDCVKFQSWSAESLYSKTYYDSVPYSKRFVNKFSLKPENLKELSIYAKECGLAFSSTPYSEEEVDFLLKECNAAYIKIASMEINNYKFLDYIGKKKSPVVLSTGMSTMEEVDRAVEVLENAGVTQMTLLHCVSIYPVELADVNLNNILGLRERFPHYPIGFSDHTEGDAASIAATTLGACLIEKHLTLDKTKAGMDNSMATEPSDFQELVQKCRSIQIAMGSKERKVSPAEMEQRKKMRRSLVLVRDLPKGTQVSEEDFYAKRPGDGINPSQIMTYVGMFTTRDIVADTILHPEDFSNVITI